MYKLHYSPDSASLVVRILLAELGVAHVSRMIDREAGELASPAYRAMHPLGQIPALETPDGPMFETAAILLHLADRHGAGVWAPAPDTADRAAFLKWFFFTSTNVHTTVMQLFYPDRVAGDEAASAVLAHARQRMQTYLAALNAMAEAERPVWLSPQQPSVLTHYLGMLIRWLASFGPDHPSYFRAADFPGLLPALTAAEGRAAVLAIAADEGLGATVYTNPAY